MTETVVSFYRFVYLENYYDMKCVLKDYCDFTGIKGTILLSEEGVNATIAGSKEAIDGFFALMNLDSRLKDINGRFTQADYQPFIKMKVRLKKEVVALGIDDLDVSCNGDYVAPENWDEFISSPDVLVIDNRNIYETRLGKFKGAIDPCNQTFREFPDWAKSWSVDNLPQKQKIAMYCTGGIRCEKSTSFMKKLGFAEVYHLEGGIINYLAKTGNESGMWEGQCFVFDDRVALTSSLDPSCEVKCVACGIEATTDDLKSVPRGRVLCINCKSDEVKPSNQEAFSE